MTQNTNKDYTLPRCANHATKQTTCMMGKPPQAGKAQRQDGQYIWYREWVATKMSKAPSDTGFIFLNRSTYTIILPEKKHCSELLQNQQKPTGFVRTSTKNNVCDAFAEYGE